MEPVKLLSEQLHEAGIPVDGVSEDGQGGFIVYYSPGATEGERNAGSAIVAAFDPVVEVAQQEAIEEVERLDFNNLADDITNQINWADTTIPEIDNGIASAGAFTNATQRAIVLGLLQNQRRIVLILRGILKAFRFIIRKVAG